jgi:hypothetical protein
MPSFITVRGSENKCEVVKSSFLDEILIYIWPKYIHFNNSCASTDIKISTTVSNEEISTTVSKEIVFMFPESITCFGPQSIYFLAEIHSQTQRVISETMEGLSSNLALILENHNSIQWN